MSTVTLEASEWQRLLDAATTGPVLDASNQVDAQIKSAIEAVTPHSPPESTSKVVLALTADKTGVAVKALPVGAVAADFARMKDQTGTGVVYGPKGVKLGEVVPGTAALPVLDAQAVNAAGNSVPAKEAWAGRLVTTPASSTPAPPEQPVPPPPPAPSGTIFGVNSGGEPTDLAACKTLGAKAVRIEVGASHVTSIASEIAAYKAQGIEVVLIAGFSGSMVTQSQLGEVAKFAREHASTIVAIELGNETSYGYQYHDGASSSSYKLRARVYASRGKELATLLAGSGVEVLLQADDGGSGSSVWVDEMFSVVPDLSSYCDGWVFHTYGAGGVSKLVRGISTLGKHGDVMTPIAITEDGISTDNGRTLSDNYGYVVNATYEKAASLFNEHVMAIKRVAGSRLGYFMYYQVRDQKKSGETTGREAYFGALKREGTSKGAMTTAVEKLLAS